jgi:hypothetical protein
MANVNSPQGLVPVSHKLSVKYAGQTTTYYIPSNDSNAYAIGDPVTLLGSSDAVGNPGCVLATAGTTNTVVGAIVGMGGRAYGGATGVNPLGNQDTTIIPATKTVAYYVQVVDDPYVIFAVQEDASQTALAAADVGLNISLKSGTNNGYISGWILDNTTKATTAALQMKLLGIQNDPSNNLGTAAVWLCMINQHPFKATVAGL